jgi:carboxypeptidase C (cathepsin A)
MFHRLVSPEHSRPSTHAILFSVGTGFSNGADAPMDEEGVSADFYNFLINWNTIFPEHATKRLYLIGESYAGNEVTDVTVHLLEASIQYVSNFQWIINHALHV